MPSEMRIFQGMVFSSGLIPVFGKRGVVTNAGVGVEADVGVGVWVDVSAGVGVEAGVDVGTGVTGFVSEHKAVVPLFKPTQDQVQAVESLTLLALMPPLQL